MKHLKTLLLALICATLVALSSCGPEDELPPPNYPINDFIFNTFLFAEGSWWAFYDSTSGEFDTLTVTSNIGQYQNVYEGDQLQFSRFYYQADWHWSVNNKKYFIEYYSDQHSTWKGAKLPQILMVGIGNTYGDGYGKLYYDGMELNDTIIAGYAIINTITVGDYFTLQEKGDSLFYQAKWNISPFVKFTLIKSVANEQMDVTFVFQEHMGLIHHTMNGNYTLIDKNIIPMIK